MPILYLGTSKCRYRISELKNSQGAISTGSALKQQPEPLNRPYNQQLQCRMLLVVTWGVINQLNPNNNQTEACVEDNRWLGGNVVTPCQSNRNDEVKTQAVLSKTRCDQLRNFSLQSITFQPIGRFPAAKGQSTQHPTLDDTVEAFRKKGSDGQERSSQKQLGRNSENRLCR